MSRRTLIHSLRRLRNDICRCHDFEFEDVIAGLESADFLLPERRFHNRLLSDMAEYLSYRTLRVPWNPSLRFPRIEKTYDLFFANMTFAYDLEVLRRLPDWRGKVGYAVCYIDELFTRSLDRYARYLPTLRQFDLVVLNCGGTVQHLADRLGVRAVGVPSGIDALRFFPGTARAPRLIDISNVGRRDEQQHAQFKELEQVDQWLYLYDTIHPDCVPDFRLHRDNLAHTLARTRFSVVNPAKFNAQTDTGGQEEIGFRYFEGAAAGTVLIGRIPVNPNFASLFPWEAVVELPADAGAIPDFLRDLAAQPDRLEKIEHNNVAGTLERHDSVYRWEAILEAAGMDPLAEIARRKERLQELAEAWESSRN
jgi:hypothetical protein